jgi:hypothetical protein
MVIGYGRISVGSFFGRSEGALRTSELVSNLEAAKNTWLGVKRDSCWDLLACTTCRAHRDLVTDFADLGYQLCYTYSICIQHNSAGSTSLAYISQCCSPSSIIFLKVI